MTENSHAITETAEHAAQHSAHAGAHHEPHELPNFIMLLAERFHESSILKFLHDWQNIFFSCVAILIISSVLLLTAGKKKLIPSGIQNFGEALVEGVENFVVGLMGEAGRKHVPFIGTLFFYILLMNFFGMIPFFKSPTAVWSTTIALAVIAVAYVQVSGIRALGFKKYFHHMAGSPPNAIAWTMGILLIFPLTLILEYLAVPLSLSLRLFANISSEDRLLYKFALINVDTNWLAMPLQIFANALVVLFSTIQAFIFTLLTSVYISILLPHEEHHEKHAEATVRSH